MSILVEQTGMAGNNTRKFFVGGNWKMNGNKSSIDGIVAFLCEGPLSQDTGTLLSRDSHALITVVMLQIQRLLSHHRLFI